MNGVRLCYKTGGSGPVVVLLHSFTHTSPMWNPLLPLLAKSHTVVTPDVRGAGKSERTQGGYDKKTMATDIRELVRHLGHDQPVAVVGHDIGLMVAYAYAAQYPKEVSKVVLMDAFLPGVGNWSVEQELTRVVRLLVEQRWPFRLHATYDESIGRFLDVFEAVNREVPFAGLRWFFDHAETVTEHNLERIKALDGGIAIQHRMAYQGEYFINRYGAQAAQHTSPITKMLSMGIPVGAGTDATRVASFNPWMSLYWMVSGRTVGGTALYPEANRLDRLEALRRYTLGSAWFSGEEDKKGAIATGYLADLAVLSSDYFGVPEAEIKQIESVMTVVGGKIVYGSEDFGPLAPPPLPILPDWSPVKEYGGEWQGLKEHKSL